MADTEPTRFAQRFRGFFPVVIDVETAGFNKNTDALLEIAVTTLKMDEQGYFTILDRKKDMNIACPCCDMICLFFAQRLCAVS